MIIYEPCPGCGRAGPGDNGFSVCRRCMETMGTEAKKEKKREKINEVISTIHMLITDNNDNLDVRINLRDALYKLQKARDILA
jgi:hypothetical protein